MKKILTALLAVSLIIPGAASALTLPGAGDRQGDRQGGRDSRQGGRSGTSTPVDRQGGRQGSRDSRQTGRDATGAARQGAIDSARAAATGKIEAVKAQLKDRLSQIRDEQKKRRVERIESHLSEINQRVTTKLQNFVFGKLPAVLAKVEERTDKAESEGKDVSAVRSLITTAENAIASASAALVAQAGKVYTVSDVIGDEKTLRTDIKPVRDQLYSDMQATRTTVEVARKAVRDAADAAVALGQTVPVLPPTTQ